MQQTAANGSKSIKKNRKEHGWKGEFKKQNIERQEKSKKVT
jgi:hypothetical protein